MNQQCRRAAERLADLLEAENALIEASDYVAVGGNVAEKRRLLAALEASCLPAEPDTEEDRAVARRLDAQARQNRTLLERALRVQDQIMRVIADAARRSQQPFGYRPGGLRPVSRTRQAVALIVRA